MNNSLSTLTKPYYRAPFNLIYKMHNPQVMSIEDGMKGQRFMLDDCAPFATFLQVVDKPYTKQRGEFRLVLRNPTKVILFVERYFEFPLFPTEDEKVLFKIEIGRDYPINVLT